MNSIDRRRFLLTVAASAASFKSFAQSPAPHTATLTLRTEKGPTVPHNFVGLSYETQQLSDPTFFTPANKGLIAQFRALTPHGVLRLGGNTSDYGFWKPTPTSVAPPRAKRDYKIGDPTPDLTYAIEPIALHNLRAFLDATGWTCLYGINFGTNTAALAAEEAAFVSATLGPKLEYFQIGNEADRFGLTIRDPKTWTADTYIDEWLVFANAIIAKVPTAKFGMPDIANNAKWFTTIGDRLANDPIVPHIACLSHHYYVGGPPSNPDVNIPNILKADPVVLRNADLVTTAASKLHKPWRMTEGNTCFRGGKPGVSDVFAASLWAADYLLLLASLGYSGVNLHGGDGQMVANSLGGTLPGELLMPDPKVPHARPFYTPIAHIDDTYVAEPVNFGMRFAAAFQGATFLKLNFDPGPVNATAYAATFPTGAGRLAVINKDATQDLTISLAPSPGFRNRLYVDHILSAPSLSSTQVTLSNGAPSALTYTVPHSTAVLFTIGPSAKHS